MNRMEFSAVKKHQLLKVTEEKLAMFETSKRHLYQNASDLKSQIHSYMSRLLETLRNREVQLLNQVDMIQSSKEEALHKQLAVLSCNLSQLQRGVECSDKDKNGLDIKFERICLYDVMPEEPIHMTFKPTPVGVKDVLMNFGKITANGVSLSAFVEPENPAASLPKQFEDYGDAEHHVLYKSVEKIKQGSNSEKLVYVNIPHLSANEWLAKPSKTFSKPTPTSSGVGGSSSRVGPSSKCLFAPFNTNKTSDWLATPNSACSVSTSGTNRSSSVCLPQLPKNTSIHDWLHQIKQNPDCEEDGFEMLDIGELNSDTDTDSIEIVSSSPPSIKSEVLNQMAGTKRTNDVDNGNWLAVKRRPALAEMSTNLPTFSYFKKVASQDLNTWLVKKKSVTAKPTCCSGSGTIRNYDIENLGDSACIENLTRKFKELSHNFKQHTCDPDDIMSVDKSPLPPVSSVCKANEICEKYSECVSQPSCVEQNWFNNKMHDTTDNKCAVKNEDDDNNNNSSSNNKQAFRFRSADQVSQLFCDKNLFGPFQKKCDLSDWLKKEKTDKAHLPGDIFSLNRKTRGSSKLLSDWLTSGSKETARLLSNPYFCFQQTKANNTKNWLTRSSPTDGINQKQNHTL